MVTHTDHEQSLTVGGRSGGLGFGDDGAAGNDGNAGKPGP